MGGIPCDSSVNDQGDYESDEPYWPAAGSVQVNVV
jgi:hypothetical protein